jgi:hypothetical protein
MGIFHTPVVYKTFTRSDFILKWHDGTEDPVIVAGRANAQSWSSCKVPVIVVRFQPKLKYVDIFKYSCRMSDYKKTHLALLELIHADGQTNIQS